MQAWIGLTVALAATGVAILVYSGLERGGIALSESLNRVRAIRAVRAVRDSFGESTQEGNEADLYGLPSTMLPWMFVSGGVGLLISFALLEGPSQLIGALASTLPLLWKRYMLSRCRQQTRRQVAELIEEMRLRLAFGGALGPVLNGIATEGREGIVYERLFAHRNLITVSGPEKLLETLACELHSPELRVLLRRIRASSQGATSYVSALQAAAEEVTQEIARHAETEVEAAPLRLLFPMLILLMPPVLVLLLYPPAYALIASLAGVGTGVTLP